MPGAEAHGGVHPSEAAAPVAEVNEAATSGRSPAVTSLVDGGGRVLRQARVVLVFCGSAWAAATARPSQAGVVQAIRDLLGGPWATQLFQYRGIGPLAVEAVVGATSGDPPAVFTTALLRSVVDAGIDAGHLPKPASSVDRVYAVLLPVGHSSADTGFVGQHQFYDRPDGTRVHWAWVTNDGTLDGVHSIPKILSHELAEACTDPDLGSGIVINGTDEVGDVCNTTFAVVGGAAQQSYWSKADGRCVLPTYRSVPPAGGNPALVHGRFGTAGNLELVYPVAGDGAVHLSRDEDTPFAPWSLPTAFGTSLGPVDGVGMIQSSYGRPGNLDAVACAGTGLYAFWRDSGPAFSWRGPRRLMSGVAGNPALLQSRTGNPGDFYVACPLADSGLAVLRRVNAGSPAWGRPTIFGRSLGLIEGLAMIQSTFGGGNLELAVVAGGNLHWFWRDSRVTPRWYGPAQVATGVAGVPALLQGQADSPGPGPFELVCPSATGGLVHLQRDNTKGYVWGPTSPFGEVLGHVDAAAMVQQPPAGGGRLQLVVRAGSQMHGFSRAPAAGSPWEGPTLLQSTTW